MDIDYNTHCYSFSKNTYDKGFLDDSVDATYIIHLKNNGRIAHIQEQLKEYQPTKEVYIVYNEGFKKCRKRLIEQVSYQDLTDAFLQCFKHANKQNYNNILILEDDFIFSPDIKKSEHIDSVNRFVNEKKDESFIYYLGCIPFIIFPRIGDSRHYHSVFSLASHAIVYSKNARNSKLRLDRKHWDVIIHDGIKNQYLYNKPLCYQICTETENQSSWLKKCNKYIYNLVTQLIKLFNLDKSPEPGFSIIYFIAKFIIPMILLIIVAAIVITIVKYSKFIRSCLWR